MDTYSLELFADAAKTLNFTKTSENFYTTQPAVSRRIKELERQLGYHLFERENHGVKLTKEGELLLPFVTKAIDSMNLGMRTVNNIIHIRKKTLTIISITPMITNFLPEIINIFNQTYPHVEFKIERMCSWQIRENMPKGDNLDIYIGEENDLLSDDSWVKNIIRADALGLVVGKNVNLNTPQEIKDYIRTKHALLLPLEEAATLSAIGRKMLVHYGSDPSMWIENSPIESIMLHIASGLGFTLHPINPFLLKAFDLKYIPLDYGEKMTMVIAHKKNAPSIVHTFSDMVLTCMKHHLRENSDAG